MSNNSPLTSATRKQFADLLADKPNSLRQRAIDAHDKKRQDLYRTYRLDFAKKTGASQVYGHYIKAKEHMEGLERSLKPLGFHLTYQDELEPIDDGSVDEAINQRIVKEIGIPADIHARFDSVHTAIMAATTLEDAQRLMKSLQSV